MTIFSISKLTTIFVQTRLNTNLKILQLVLLISLKNYSETAQYTVAIHMKFDSGQISSTIEVLPVTQFSKHLHSIYNQCQAGSSILVLVDYFLLIFCCMESHFKKIFHEKYQNREKILFLFTKYKKNKQSMKTA